MIKISAIICTFKRPDYLRHALRSLGEQTLASEEFEVIVVDNCGDFETERVFQEFSDGRPNFRYVVEARVGLSNARNTGCQDARGRYIAYLDDDAAADPRWLEALLSTFESVGAAAVGGRVWLDWQGQRPRWVPEKHLSLFTFVDHGDVGHRLKESEYLVGANIAFEKQALLAVGGFDPDLGRQGAVLLSGEEAATLELMRSRNMLVYYEPSALVWHSVIPARKHPRWLLKRLFWDGATQPLVDRASHRQSRRSISLSAYRDLRACARWIWDILIAVLKGKKASAWESLLGLSQRAGRLRTQVRLLAGGNAV
jgi:glycosyltransferase involved in cell wall biosynthesis